MHVLFHRYVWIASGQTVRDVQIRWRKYRNLLPSLSISSRAKSFVFGCVCSTDDTCQNVAMVFFLFKRTPRVLFTYSVRYSTETVLSLCRSRNKKHFLQHFLFRCSCSIPIQFSEVFWSAFDRNPKPNGRSMSSWLRSNVYSIKKRVLCFFLCTPLYSPFALNNRNCSLFSSFMCVR